MQPSEVSRCTLLVRFFQPFTSLFKQLGSTKTIFLGKDKANLEKYNEHNLDAWQNWLLSALHSAMRHLPF